MGQYIMILLSECGAEFMFSFPQLRPGCFIVLAEYCVNLIVDVYALLFTMILQ